MNPVMRFIHKTGSPAYFYTLACRFVPWLWELFGITLVIGLYLGLLRSPADYLQGESVRIMYVHVPSAWMSMMIYALMAIFAAIGLIWRIRIAEILAISSAPVGAAFTLIALVTGSLWGRPTWGTWWEWDARLTSELVLLFLYLGIMLLYSAIEEPRKAARITGVLTLVGVINLPIIHYSVVWWNTLHQASSVGVTGTSIHPDMLWPLLIMALATKFFYGASLLTRARVRLLEQDWRKRWVLDALPDQRR